MTNDKINSIISSLACDVFIAVRIGDSCLPLRLCNISNEFKDEGEIFSGLGTVLFHGKFSIKATHATFIQYLGERDLKQIYLKGITLCDSLMDNVLPKCTSLNTLQLVDCCIHDGTPPNAVANMLSQMLRNATFLEHLNLSGCRLKTEHMKIILEALTQVVSIVTISLSDNNLAYGIFDLLASVITCNRGLKCVEVSNCNLQGAAILSIIKALEICEDLLSLDFSNNVITDDMAVIIATLIEICQSIQVVRLQSCQLQYAGIQKIVEAMVKKTCLQCIDFSDIAISHQNAILIASVIVKNTNLRKLIFSNCKLQNADFQQLFQATAKITSLVHLDLSNNLFTNVTVGSFALMIHQNVSLEYLNISGCCVKAKDFEKFTHSLITLKSLTHLDLSCNVTNITSADNITIIITNNTFLEYLNLSKCEFRIFAFLKVLCALQNSHYMKHLDLNSNLVDYEEATEIATAVSKNPFLEKIDFGNYNVTEQGVKIILLSLRNHTSLKHFDISSNTITNDVVNDIVDVIDSNTQLTHLNISDTDVQEYGILKIFKAAQRINTLKSIKLCNCTISDQAARAIADAISVNCMMEELVLTNNSFHETGIAILFDVLREIHTLKYLTIACNIVISSITAKITEAVCNNHITFFDLSNCDLQKSSCSLILNTLISQAPNLQHIDLSGNNLSGTAETIAQLISVSYDLQHVNLANTLMQDEEVTIIVKAMENITSLHYVDLTSSSYRINDELTVELQNTIDKNAAVISFRFSKLCLKKYDTTVTAVGRDIFSVVISLQQISVCFTDCKNDTFDKIAALINNSSNFQCLHLENCSLVEINFSNFIVALSRTTTLEYFCMINFVITDEIDDGIATVIENNHQLRHFELVACKLTENGLTRSIQSFNFTRLSYLILSKLNNLIIHNTRQLKRPICDSLTHLNLSSVHLDVTKLSFLSLSALTKLRYLDLSHNPLTDESANILSSVILNNNGLQHLDLCNCKLQSEGIRVISDSLQTVNVTYLDMSLNTTNVEIFNNNLMPALLPILKLIEYLYLPYCELKRNEIENLYDMIRNAVNLKCIDVGPSAFSKSMVSKCKDIMFVSEGLKYITFSTEGIIKQGSLTDYETEKFYHSLHYLNVNDIIVDDHVGDIVAGLIANSPKLEYLEMAGDKWNITNVMKCFSSLQNNHLMYLNFSNKSDCLNFSLTEIFYSLRGCTALEVLDLHNCCTLKCSSTISITTETPTVTFLHLSYLDLSNNYIDDEAVDYLTALIAANVGLEYVNFCNYKLSPSGIQNIKNALKSAASLKFLGICFTDCNSKILDDVQTVALLATNKHLEQLGLSNLVLDNTKLHQIQSHLCVVKGLQRLILNDCICTDKDTNTIISLIANNPKLCELILLDCEISVESKLKCTFVSAALDKQYLKLDTITIANPRNKYSLNTNTLLHRNVSKLTLGCSFPHKFSEVSFLLTLNLNFEDLMISIITNNPELSQFTLCRCEITESALVKIFSSIAKNLRNLLYVNFSHLNCSLKVVNHITTVISCNTKLKHINLCNCQLLTVDVKSILKTAKNLTALEYFDLSGNQVTGYLANDIATLIANDKNTKEVNLPNYTLLITDCHLKLVLNTVTDILVNDIATIIATNKSNTKLSLLNCTLNNDQLKVVLHAVKECSVLPCINFNIEEIENVTGTTKVFNLLVLKNIVVFHQNSNLVKLRGTHHLGIIGCSFYIEEWNVLKHVLACSTTLSTLILQDCQLYGTISEIVEVCTHLSYLDLTNVKIAGSNKLRSSSVWLSDIEPKPNKLRTFSLNCMDFTEQVMVDILSILHGSKIIDYFVMVNCSINDHGILWPDFTYRNLLHLDLSYSRMSRELVDCILTHSSN